jgi:serine/threonine protein kinase
MSRIAEFSRKDENALMFPGVQTKRRPLVATFNRAAISVEQRKQLEKEASALLVQRVFNAHALRILRFLPLAEVRNFSLLNPFFHQCWLQILSTRVVASFSLPPSKSLLSSKQEDKLESFHKTFKDGKWLADGACKQVYSVFYSPSGKTQALSVMDVKNFSSDNDTLKILLAEINISLAVSALVQQNICCNFLQTYSVFCCPWAPFKHFPGLWKEKGKGKKRQVAVSNDQFVYIRMELCKNGDLESFLRNRSNDDGELIEDTDEQDSLIRQFSKISVARRSLPPSIITSAVEIQTWLLELGMGIYASRKCLQLLHLDLKNLNFLLTPVSDISEKDTLLLQYKFGPNTFSLVLPKQSGNIVKIADFGTSKISDGSTKISSETITTLENCAPEILILGDQVSDLYFVDTWMFGLSVVHMFLQCKPYEEVLEQVKCPDEMILDLEKVWKSSKQYKCISSNMFEDDNHVFCHTLYRYLVLFGMETISMFPSENAVIKIINKHLSPKSKSIRKQFLQDLKLYNLWTGSFPVISSARDRIDALPHTEPLIRSIISLHPSRRPTMKSFLLSDYFKPLRQPVTIDSHKTFTLLYSAFESSSLDTLSEC